MHHLHTQRAARICVALSLFIAAVATVFIPEVALADTTSPFMTGATSLQTNILAWLTPVAIILVMVLGGMAMANRIVENCANTLILRCSASEGGGTARFASQLIGDREISRMTESHSHRYGELGGSMSQSEHFSVEPAVLPAQIEQLPDLAGYLKHASDPHWHKVRLDAVQRWNERRSEHHSARPAAHAELERGGRDHE